MITSVTSIRHWRKFYLALLGIFVLHLLVSLLILGLFFHSYGSSQFESRYYGLLSLFAIILASFIYIVYRFIFLAPSIEVNSEFIKLNSTVHDWKDLEKIEMTGKRNFVFLTQREGVLLKFKDQKPNVFLDGLYANTAQIKSFIKYVVIDKVSYPDEIEPPHANEIHSEKFITYKRLQIFNFRGMMLLGYTALYIYVMLRNSYNPAALIIISVFWLPILCFFSWCMYYFELSEYYLLIKNPNYFWWKKLYRIADIKEIVFESGVRMPTCLRVITKDFHSEMFPGASLWGKDWRALRDEFEKRDIKVRLEVSIEELNIVSDIAADFRNTVKDVFPPRDKEK